MNIAYAAQGGLGLPDTTYYFDEDKADKLATPTRPTSPRCWSCPASPAADAAAQAKDVMAFETRLAKASKSQRGDVARRLAVLQPGHARPTPTS